MKRLSLEEAPFGSFHRRLAVYANGGSFCDGYILSSFGRALAGLALIGFAIALAWAPETKGKTLVESSTVV